MAAGLAGWLVELTEIDGHVDPAVTVTEVAVMAGDRDLFHPLHGRRRK